VLGRHRSRLACFAFLEGRGANLVEIDKLNRIPAPEGDLRDGKPPTRITLSQQAIVPFPSLSVERKFRSCRAGAKIIVE
jgi:hypothetical protein